MRSKICACLISALVGGAVLLQAAPARAEVDYTNTVTVAASGQVGQQADVATINFGLRDSASTPRRSWTS